jgi:cation-transporting ATPase 13A3/4/5
MKEFLHPFFLFQLYSILLWFYEGYIYFTTVLVMMTAYSLIFDVIVARENFLKIRKMAYYSSLVSEFASFDPIGPIRRVSTKQLIPGTMIYVRENFQLPCDCILLEGECLVDEASLTGESIPVPKCKVTNDIDFNKKNILFDGTTIV